MKRSGIWQRLGDFLTGRGFYVVLLLCVATVGLSGYYLIDVFRQTTAPAAQAGVETEVTVPDEPAVRPEKPTVKRPERTQQPVKSVPAPAPAARTEPAPEPQPVGPVYTSPVRGEVIANYSLEVLAYDETMGDWRTHSGMDLAAEPGERVQAVCSGQVTEVYEDALMGWTVRLAHPDGLVSTYCNLAADPPVAVGEQVVTGTVIGTVGGTAIAEAGRPSHLHLEMSRDGEPVDPANVLP